MADKKSTNPKKRTAAKRSSGPSKARVRASDADLAAEERQLRARLEEIEKQRWIESTLGKAARALLDDPPAECRHTARLLAARPNVLRQMAGSSADSRDATDQIVAFFLDAVGASKDARKPLYQPSGDRALKFSEIDPGVVDSMAGGLKEYAQHWWAVPKFVGKVVAALPKR